MRAAAARRGGCSERTGGIVSKGVAGTASKNLMMLNDEETRGRAPEGGSGIRSRRRIGPVLGWLFVSTFLVYLFFAGSNFSSGDSFSELHVTASLVDHGWFDVPVQTPGQLCAGWGCMGTDGRFYSTHAIGYSLFMLPFYGIAEAAQHVTAAPNCGNWTRCVPIHLVSWNTALLTAGTVTLLALFGVELGYPLLASVCMALLYGFASMAWPYARFGFDVTLTGLLVLAAMRETWHACAATRSPWRSWLRAGIFSALAILVRLPTAVAFVPLAIVCWTSAYRLPVRERASALAGFAGPICISLAFTAWYDAVRFGSMFDDGHSQNAADHLSTTPWVGLSGLLISPGKGLMWYCPLVLLVGLALPAFYHAHGRLCVGSLSVALVSMIPYAVVNDWYGGDAWGPRFFMPVLPLICLPLLELAGFMSRSRRASLVCWALIVVSIVIQLAGQLVSYPERLLRARQLGYANDIYWNAGHSPILDHLGTLITYLTHPNALTRTSDLSQTFDIWWLNLWRNDGVTAWQSMTAGALVGVVALLAVARLVALLAGQPRRRA